MKAKISIYMLAVILLAGGLAVASAKATSDYYPANINPDNFNPGHYMLVSSKEGELQFNLVKDNPDFIGVKKFYKWVDLETAPGVYDFSEIEKDLRYLENMNKRLFIQIIETQNNTKYKPWVPKYMWDDSSYGCGYKYTDTDGVEKTKYYGTYERTVNWGGWFPCYWNEKTRNAFYDFYTALGNRFNREPYFEGIALSETSTGYCPDCGYNVAVLEKFFKTAALRTRDAFSNKTVLQMINYAPFDSGEFAAWLSQNNIGIGGPDVHLDANAKKTLNNIIYPFYLKYRDKVVTGIDVQWDNYERYGQTPRIILDGAIEKTNPYYMFWDKRQPVFNDEVVPLLRSEGQLPAAKAFYESRGQSNQTQTPTPYTCQYTNSKWKCGCTDTACETPKWNLQKFSF